MYVLLHIIFIIIYFQEMMSCNTRVPPLTTVRLHPISQQTRSATVSITDTGTVKVHHTRSNETFEVAADGLTVSVIAFSVVYYN